MAHANFYGSVATIDSCNGHLAVTSDNSILPVGDYASVRKVEYVVNPENQEPWKIGQRPQLERFPSCHNVTVNIHLDGDFLQPSSIATGAIALRPFDGESTAAREQVTSLEVRFQGPWDSLGLVFWSMSGLAMRLPGYLPNLTSLDFCSLPRLNRDQHHRQHFGKALAQLTYLKELIVPCCDDLEGLEYLQRAPLRFLRVRNSAGEISMMGASALASIEHLQYLVELDLQHGAVLLQPSYVSKLTDGLRIQELMRGVFARSMAIQVNICTGFDATVCDMALCVKLSGGLLDSVEITSAMEPQVMPLLKLSRLAQQLRASRKLSPRFELDLRKYAGLASSLDTYGPSLKPLRKLLERSRRVLMPPNVCWPRPGGRGIATLFRGGDGELERVLALMGKPGNPWVRTNLAVRKAVRRAHDGLMRRLVD